MTPPNIVFLHAHNTGRFIQPYGYAVPTPNLQRLAEQGVMLRGAFAVSPTCSPSRAALLTGQHPHVNGLIGLTHRGFRVRDYSRTLIRLLNDAGYHTVLAGLQHIAPDRLTLGYGQDLTPPDTHAAGVIPGALRFLHDAPRLPFFLDVGIKETHRPFPQASPLDDARYVRVPPALPDTPATRADYITFLASARVMDDAFGQVLRTLDERGLAENTLVLCLADHGLQFPHYMANVNDRGLETFFLMRGPAGSGYESGKVIDAMVNHLDVLPTLCEFAGIDAPIWAEGTSLSPLVRGEVDTLHDVLFSEQTYHAAYDPQRSIRTPRYRYVRFFGDRDRVLLPNVDQGLSRDELMEFGLAEQHRPAEALYDLVFDPGEANDISQSPRAAEVCVKLRGELDAWMRRTNDPLLAGPVLPPAGSQVCHPDGLHPNDRVEKF